MYRWEQKTQTMHGITLERFHLRRVPSLGLNDSNPSGPI
jgi:hypothetical protein